MVRLWRLSNTLVASMTAMTMRLMAQMIATSGLPDCRDLHDQGDDHQLPCQGNDQPFMRWKGEYAEDQRSAVERDDEFHPHEHEKQHRPRVLQVMRMAEEDPVINGNLDNHRPQNEGLDIPIEDTLVGWSGRALHNIRVRSRR